MSMQTVVQAGLSQFTRRFLLVSVIPAWVLAVFVWLLWISGAPKDSPTGVLWTKSNVTPGLGEAVNVAEGVDFQDVLLLLTAGIVWAVVTHPLQLNVVRLFEGYWEGSRIGRRLAYWGANRHISRQSRLDRFSRSSRQGFDSMHVADRNRLERESGAALYRAVRLYPVPHRVLPTLLGNVLRAAEDRAGEPYGLDAVAIWPRLYVLLPEMIRGILNDQRMQLDVAVSLCLTWLLATAASAAILLYHGVWLVVPMVTYLLAWLSYRAAVAAAVEYGSMIETAVDLYRFELVRALHLPLLASLEIERDRNEALTEMLKNRDPSAMRTKKYSHTGAANRWWSVDGRVPS